MRGFLCGVSLLFWGKLKCGDHGCCFQGKLPWLPYPLCRWLNEIVLQILHYLTVCITIGILYKVTQLYSLKKKKLINFWFAFSHCFFIPSIFFFVVCFFCFYTKTKNYIENMHLRSYKCLLNQLKPCEMVILFCFNSSWHDFAEKLQKAVFLQWKDKMMWFKNAMWLLSSSTFMACMFFVSGLWWANLDAAGEASA